MVRATIPFNNYENHARENFRRLGLSTDDLLDKRPSDYSDTDRATVVDALRLIMERLAKHDADNAAVEGLSPGASSLLRSLKGSPARDYTLFDDWSARFATREAAEAAARELERAGMIVVDRRALAIALTSHGASILGS